MAHTIATFASGETLPDERRATSGDMPRGADGSDGGSDAAEEDDPDSCSSFTDESRRRPNLGVPRPPCWEDAAGVGRPDTSSTTSALEVVVVVVVGAAEPLVAAAG